MLPLLTRVVSLRIARWAQRAHAREEGFTLIETLMAAVILLILMVSITGVITSAIASHTVSRSRTNAEECANDQVEKIRRLALEDYSKVGVSGGNPPGTIAATAPCASGLAATATVAISYEDDPTPTSYATAANYKKVTVVVTRDSDGKQLASVVTYVSPQSRAPYGGINNAIINVKVVDLGNNLAYEGATVFLKDGPSSNRSDTTDVAGLVTFAALDPNPTTGPTSYYNLTVTAATGYETLPADLPPGTATPPTTVSHVQVAPSQTLPVTPIRIFKPGTINLTLIDAGGSPYTGGAALKITSSFTGATTTDTVASGASGKTITMLGTSKVIPGATYTIEGRTTSGLCAFPTPSPVPASGYPTNTTGSFTLQFTPCPAGTIAVNVKQLGANISGADVTITGGPNNMSITGPPQTDLNGNASFSVPAGTGYTVSASKVQSAPGASAAVTVGATTNVALVLGAPPNGTLVVNVTQLGGPVNGATVTVSGGPWSITQQLTTPSGATNGQVTFSGIPGGTGYTVTAVKVDSYSTTTAIPSGTTTTVNLPLPNPPTGTVNVTATWLSALQSNALIQLTGGPYSVNVSGTTVVSPLTGVISFTNIPAGTGYTLVVSKNGQSKTLTSVTVTTGTNSIPVALPTGTITTTVTWAGKPVGILPAPGTVTITGGPLAGTYTGSTDASGVAQITVPSTNATYPYTVKAQKTSSNQVTAASTVTSLADGADQPSSVALTPTKVFTITIQRGASTASGASLTGLTVSITGGPNGTLGGATIYQFTPVVTNSSSVITTTITVPAVVSGSTPNYTIKVWGCSLSGTTNKIGSKTLQSAVTGTTPVTVNLNSTSGTTCPPTP